MNSLNNNTKDSGNEQGMGDIFWRKLIVILHCLFQPSCNSSDECQCHEFHLRQPFMFLGCFARENITCPAIEY